MAIMGTHCFSLLSIHYLLWRQHPGVPLGHPSAFIIPFALGRADPTPSFESGHVGSRISRPLARVQSSWTAPAPSSGKLNRRGKLPAA